MVTPNKPIDVYVRVSYKGTRTIETGFLSPDIQVQTATSYLNTRGFHVGIELPHDIDHSGGKFDRPGLNLALERIRSGISGGICVAFHDRYSRDVIQGWQTLEDIIDAGGYIYGPDIPDVETPEGWQQWMTSAVASEYLIRKSRDYARKGRQRAIETGCFFSKFVPMGYSKQDRKLIPNQDAEHITQAFQMRADGIGPSDIAKYLNEHNVKTSHGGNPSRAAVHTMIQNRVYLGEVSYTDVDPKHSRVNRNAHLALVEEHIWLAAQPNGVKPTSLRETATVLKGLLKCGSCHFTLQGTKNGSGTRLYRCQGQSAKGTCDNRVYILAEKIEAFVETTFFAIVQDLHVTKYEDPEDYSDLEAQLRKAENRVKYTQSDRFIEAYGDDGYALAKTARDTRDTLKAELAHKKTSLTSPDRKLILDAKLTEAWPHMTSTQRNRLYHKLFESITIIKLPDHETELQLELTPAIQALLDRQ